MKPFIAFVEKEFRHIVHDRFSIMALLMLLTVQMLLFGLVFTTEVKVTKMAVFDPSKDISTGRLIEKLNVNRYLMLVEELQSPDDIQRVFAEGKASLVVVFSENFHDNLLHTGECAVQLIADATAPNQAFVGYATNIINEYRQELMREMRIPLQIVSEVRMLHNPQLKGSFNLVPGAMGVILFLICAMMTAISIVREKERGTMEQLLAKPMKPIYFILGKVTPYFILALIDLCIILLFAFYVMHVPVAGSLFLLILLALLLIIGGLFTGVLMSNVLNSQNTVMLISGVGLVLLSVILSGMVLAIESMPAIYQWVAAILPSRWFIEAARKVMIQGVDIAFVAKEIIILVCITAFIIFLSLKTFRIKLKY